jgi:hypothetical protein
VFLLVHPFIGRSWRGSSRQPPVSLSGGTERDERKLARAKLHRQLKYELSLLNSISKLFLDTRDK